MRRPLLLDLFCGAGGAAKGYQRAGFYVVGVDIEPQPNYCGDEFHQENVMDLVLSSWLDFEAIHASPPCQHYANVTRWRGNQDNHPDLIAATLEQLRLLSVPWVVENVRTPELGATFMLCGSQFGLRVRRHRYFASSFPLPLLVEPCRHRSDDYSFDHGAKQPESVYRRALGVDWMSVEESRQAIPPAYTEFIGAQLLAHIREAA